MSSSNDTQEQHGGTLDTYILTIQHPAWSILPPDSDSQCPALPRNLRSFSHDNINTVIESGELPWNSLEIPAWSIGIPPSCITFSRFDFRARLFQAFIIGRVADIYVATYDCRHTRQVLHRVIISFDVNTPNATSLITDFTLARWQEIVAWANGILDYRADRHYIDEIVALTIFEIECRLCSQTEEHFLQTLLDLLEGSEIDEADVSDPRHKRQALWHLDTVLLATDVLVHNPTRHRAAIIRRLPTPTPEVIEGHECAICRYAFEAEGCEDPVKLPCPCLNLFFGRACVGHWIMMTGMCPQCKSVIQ